MRYSAIEIAHKTTFSWIFHPSLIPDNDPRPEIDFLDWLRGGQGIYWVTGKPGELYNFVKI